jgi:Tectonin domain
MKNRRVSLFLASIVCWAGIVVPASAQEFAQVAGTLTQIAAGRAEVWGLNASQQVFRYNAAGKKFAKLAGKVTLTQIAVGGGTLLQSDDVWGVDVNTHVFHYDFTTKKLVQVQANLTQIVVGEGDIDNCHPYEVWGTNASELVYRYNYCSGEFDQIQGTLTHISTGGGDVWGLNGEAQIFQFNFAKNNWVNIGGSLQQIAVGVNDVWGLDGSGKVYRFDRSAGFILIDGSQVFTQIAAGGNGAWGITTNPNENIFRFDPNVQIEVSVPGVLTQISSGSGAGIWGVNSAHAVFSFVRP